MLLLGGCQTLFCFSFHKYRSGDLPQAGLVTVLCKIFGLTIFKVNAEREKKRYCGHLRVHCFLLPKSNQDTRDVVKSYVDKWSDAQNNDNATLMLVQVALRRQNCPCASTDPSPLNR